MGTLHGMSRRQFLRAAGVAIALPHFPSAFPRADGASTPPVPTRLLFTCVPLGFVPNQSVFKCQMFADAGSTGWLPEQAGPLATLPPVHAALQPYAEHLSFLRNLTNKKYRGEIHSADDTFLTCADTLADPSRSFANSISCDQVAAAAPALGGPEVRHRCLVLATKSSNAGLSWSANGAPVSAATAPAAVFDLLFGKDDVPAAVRLARLRDKRSVLDLTRSQIADLNRALDSRDRAKLDELLSAVRDVEAEIQLEEKWLSVPKPLTAQARPAEDIGPTSRTHATTMLALIHAAFLTDTTRVVTYHMPSSYLEVSPTAKHGLNHDLTPERAADAIKVDAAMSEVLAGFFKALCDTREADGAPLMQHVLGVYGSGLWGPNHQLKDLPIMAFGHGGGRVRQGHAVQFAADTPLSNLWLTMLTAADAAPPGRAFADSTGTLAPLLAG